jgi:DNA-binding HxlR family transcriptional regulator
MMIALQLAPGRMRLSQLHEYLPGASSGVLTRYVHQMAALGLLSRTRFKEMPPRVELELTDAGRELLPIAEALSRWGMRHMWSAPQAREQVDPDTLLRLLPVLAWNTNTGGNGSIEAIVTHTDPVVRRRYRVEQGQLRCDDEAVGEATARIAGDTNAWTAALGPACDYRRLRFTGDRRLARHLLDCLPGRG